MSSLKFQFVTGVAGLLFLVVTNAQEINATLKITPLPEPLTLKYALSLAQDQHPSLQRVNANIQRALASEQSIDAGDDLTVRLEGQVRWVGPPDISPDQTNDDHRLSLIASKTLYDFGRQDSRQSAASDDVESQRLSYQEAVQEHHVLVMRRFFDVLLADLKFYRYNEEMAVAYIQYDRMKQRRRLKQAIDVDVLKLETEYQKVRRLRFNAEAMQRQTRAKLAAILNHPGQLPSTLAPPELPILKTKLPEVEGLQELALKHNLRLRVLRKKLAAVQQRELVAQRTYGPTLTGTVEAHAYTRKLGSSDSWRAGVTLDVPLYTGDRTHALVAEVKANEYELQSQIKELEYNISQAVLETWLNIDTLRIQRQEMKTRADYEDTALDQSRSLYELEIKSDLGMAMVNVSEAAFQVKQTDYAMAVAWERLKLLTGQLDSDLDKQTISTPGDKHE